MAALPELDKVIQTVVAMIATNRVHLAPLVVK